ncbi:MAG: flagellar basal body L-ring protein FlgH [Gemmatimonadaceae bacterium]|nr:flagellar basal body L-ring protein FlgH [Gemmatimonadaceae bacterium]
MKISQRDMMRATALIGLTMFLTQHLHAQPRRDSVVVSPAAPATALNARPGRLNWTSDRRAFAVGDLVIVHIDEYTLASANMTDNATQRRKKDTDFQLITPGATAATAPGAAFNTSNNGESTQRGDRTRQLRLDGEITARVMSIDPVTGVLTIKGTKTIGVDKEQQLISFTGAIRPQDLGGTNTIASSRVADAKLDITNKGSLGKAKQGLLSKILSAFWP